MLRVRFRELADGFILEEPVAFCAMSEVGQSSCPSPSEEGAPLNAKESAGFCGFDK